MAAAPRRQRPRLARSLWLPLLLGAALVRGQAAGSAEAGGAIDLPDTAEVRRLDVKKVTQTTATIMLQLTDIPKWSEEQPFFLHPVDDPGTFYVPQRFRLSRLRSGEYCDIQFKGLYPNTTYIVKLNWSLKATYFPAGWSLRTKAEGEEL
mmetsp:Transcript_18231/g.41200  ORF Transcript_18231/g.41200 Transcript_18231/m.41200 type:complete len:150 (+) Transcript_18231:87-536(+)